MKHILLALFLLLSTTASAQTTTDGSVPFKKANAILIQTPDTGRVALRRLASLLQERGYSVDQLNYDLHSLSTKPKTVGKSGLVLSVTALYQPAGLLLRGQYQVPALNMSVPGVAEFSGMEGGANKLSFRELETIGKAYYPEAKLEYLLKP
ncbi:hypothetical protein [uncultured Hymenobacter sp.]|uniref:hypothetical protein n=1 Tax=uncultured Hymenobacter sp. TaxID=170016 RepID=UPI0035C9F766